MIEQRHALLCGYHVPQPDLDSSSRRLFHFVRFLQDVGWEVTVAAKNTASLDARSRHLRRRGVAVYPLGDRDLDDLIESGTFDVAILAFWHIAERLLNALRIHSPQTRVLVDSMDLHFVRQARRVFAGGNGAGAPLLDSGYAQEMAREVNVYATADVVLAVSQKETELIDDVVGQAGLARFVPDCEDAEPSALGFDERKGLVFIGNFEHPPNADGARFLCEEIMPLVDPALIEEHPLRIVGNDLEAALPGYTPPVDNVQMVGWVPSVLPYLERSRVSLLPLRYGAGTKRKLIQALMVGTPSVCTSIGAEGFEAANGEEVLVADDPAEFAAGIEQLLTDPTLWQRLHDGGRELAAATRGLEVGRRHLLAAIDHVLSASPKALLLPDVDDSLPGHTAPAQDYEALVGRLRGMVEKAVPSGSTVAVVSRGDPDLVALDGRRGWHFPQQQDGEYAASYPADSAGAIRHLEALRTAGADFLVVPATSRWWLTHYAEFGDHLTSSYRVVLDRPDTCLVVDLRAPDEIGRSTAAVVETKRLRLGGRATGTPLPAGWPEPITLRGSSQPLISVAIPTRDRADLLAASLDSLAMQSLPRDQFEVVVVDDGSEDETLAVCEQRSGDLSLEYVRLERSGIAVAKNTGLFAATAPIVLFFDDDDVADRDLLLEHVSAHQERPEPEVAVLGYTTWAPTIAVSEVMHFVTDVGHYLFSYDGLVDGQLLDFTYFWGGRASCKRAFLVEHGTFRPEFTFGSEDIELAFRLSKAGFGVVYRQEAIQYMNRPITFDEFCDRCLRQGRSQWWFARMHDEDVVRDWCQVEDVEARWREREPQVAANLARVRELELQLAGGSSGGRARKLREELWKLYWWSFDALKAKGIVEAMEQDSDGSAERPGAILTAGR